MSVGVVDYVVVDDVNALDVVEGSGEVVALFVGLGAGLVGCEASDGGGAGVGGGAVHRGVVVLVGVVVAGGGVANGVEDAVAIVDVTEDVGVAVVEDGEAAIAIGTGNGIVTANENETAIAIVNDTVTGTVAGTGNATENVKANSNVIETVAETGAVVVAFESFVAVVETVVATAPEVAAVAGALPATVVAAAAVVAAVVAMENGNGIVIGNAFVTVAAMPIEAAAAIVAAVATVDVAATGVEAALLAASGVEVATVAAFATGVASVEVQAVVTVTEAAEIDDEAIVFDDEQQDASVVDSAFVFEWVAVQSTFEKVEVKGVPKVSSARRVPKWTTCVVQDLQFGGVVAHIDVDDCEEVRIVEAVDEVAWAVEKSEEIVDVVGAADVVVACDERKGRLTGEWDGDWEVGQRKGSGGLDDDEVDDGIGYEVLVEEGSNDEGRLEGDELGMKEKRR